MLFILALYAFVLQGFFFFFTLRFTTLFKENNNFRIKREGYFMNGNMMIVFGY